MKPSAPTPAIDAATERFFGLLASSLAQGLWHKLVLARPHGAEPGLQRVVVRPLLLRGQACLSFVYSHATRDITKNLPTDEGQALLRTLIKGSFRSAHLLTPAGETELRIGKKGSAHLSLPKAVLSAVTAAVASVEASSMEAPVAPAAHDRAKQRWIDLTRPFLTELGVTTAQHQLVPAMARKWKQINKFIEVFAHALDASPLADAKTVRIADFGAGRGYLTFAIHDWLRHARHVDAHVTGVELRAEQVQQANDAIARLGLQGLHFEAGDVSRRDVPGAPGSQAGAMDVMIALHACDTATDHAIHLGLRAGASIIMCSPCCHKQLRPQLLSPHPLRPVFAHGIHAEQQAEMLTDSLRALLLEASGYDTQVFEFVALEHTRKNKMILAVKRRVPKPVDATWTQIDELKRYFGIREQALETLLAADGAVPAFSP